MDAFVTRLPKPKSEPSSTLRSSPPKQTPDRPLKKVKREESPDLYSDDSGSDHTRTTRIQVRRDVVDEVKEEVVKDDSQHHHQPTDIESALPATGGEKEAIEEYEALKSSQSSAPDDDATAVTRPRWIKGQSSIYVDAFNLALDTVLDEESHLFDSKENEVFEQWKNIGYQAQYLYVPSAVLS